MAIRIFFCPPFILALDDPGLSPAGKNERLETLRRCGFEEHIAYTVDVRERFTFVLGLDNRNQFDFTPEADSGDGNSFSYAVLEPSFSAGYDPGFGDFCLTSSFPFAYDGGMALDYTVLLAFNAPIGFGLGLSGRFWNLWVDRDSEYGRTNPAFQYGETEMLLNYWRGPFFASLTLTADETFRRFSVEPCLSYRIKNITLFAGLLFNNLGAEGSRDEIRLNLIQGKRDVSSVIPSIGIKYRFYLRFLFF